MNIQRLTVLREFLLHDLPCETTATAFLYATKISEFQALGLNSRPSNFPGDESIIFLVNEEPPLTLGWDAVELFFDLTEVQARAIFLPVSETNFQYIEGETNMVFPNERERVVWRLNQAIQGTMVILDPPQ